MLSRGEDTVGLHVRGLTYRLADRQLINGIDLDLAPSGVTVVIGPNGAGKSLLLRLLHGLITPTHGEIAWNGVPIDETIRTQQAMVFQRPVLLRRSVAANLDFALKLRWPRRSWSDLRHANGDGAFTERREALLDRVGLQDKANQPARQLSGGEQQRLALARALATEPAILFLDEPTANLDPASVALIERIVQETQASGAKIIFVTHDIGQARRLADDVVFLHRGGVAEVTPASRFFTDPQSEVAATYLGGHLVL